MLFPGCMQRALAIESLCVTCAWPLGWQEYRYGQKQTTSAFTDPRQSGNERSGKNIPAPPVAAVSYAEWSHDLRTWKTQALGCRLLCLVQLLSLGNASFSHNGANLMSSSSSHAQASSNCISANVTSRNHSCPSFTLVLVDSSKGTQCRSQGFPCSRPRKVRHHRIIV